MRFIKANSVTQSALAAPQAPARLNDARILNSWKAIALYVGLGVRTVQRYETELGFPVRRTYKRKRSSVVAIPGEIDAWLSTLPLRWSREGVSKHCEAFSECLEQIRRHANECPNCNKLLQACADRQSARQAA